jgi:putative sterol carrier protein
VTELTCRDFFTGLESRFSADKAGQLEAVFQFELLGESGGQWAIEVAGGACKVTEGRAETPNLTAIMSASDFEEMVNGRLNPQLAFMSGKLSIRPMDLELAQAFGRVFF